MSDELKKSPLAPDCFPDIPPIDGVTFSSTSTGVKYKNRTDLMLVHLCPGTAIAGVFTKSATRAAPVLDCQAKIGNKSTEGAAIIVNSGNANAFTGKRGNLAVSSIVTKVAQEISVPKARVLTSSTGVIGEPLPADRIIEKIGELKQNLSDTGIEKAAEAIMTTDTYAKGSYAELNVDRKVVKIAGIAKGSGMIAPDMATMLVYLFTDAEVQQPILQSILGDINEDTFNAITVDSDTSTSDTVLLAATGMSKVCVTQENENFKNTLRKVMCDLAHQVVRDGEGASKFVEVSVVGAQHDMDAKTHAFAIANSPLVKTALAGTSFLMALFDGTFQRKIID